MPVKKRPFEGPKLLICHEKHGDAYFHIPDEATLHTVALSILKGRHKVGYWYYAPDPKDRPKKPDYDTKEKVDELKGEIRNKALKILARYTGELARFDQDKKQYDRIVEAIKKKDGETAWDLLRERSYGEYEKVTLECYETKYQGE